jgi:preflagellin peptidase FlaK
MLRGGRAATRTTALYYFSGALDLELARVCLAFAMLGIAAAMDIRQRYVDDRLWIVFGAVAAMLYFFDFQQLEIPVVLLSLGLGGSASYMLYRTGLFGGADALALIVFTAILPTYEGKFFLQQGLFAKAQVHQLSPVILLSNAAILSFAHVVINMMKNMQYRSRHQSTLFEGIEGESLARKAMAIMLGHRSDGSGFAFLMERNYGSFKKFDFSLKSAENTPFEFQVGVWVMPAIPFLVYMLAGLTVMILIGDLASAFLFGFIGAS